MNLTKESDIRTHTSLKARDSNIATPYRPETFRGQRGARFVAACRRLKVKAQLDVGNVTGSIQISAELDSPTVYPGPASKVTTTLYA
jgi:hypothetical protein